MYKALGSVNYRVLHLGKGSKRTKSLKAVLSSIERLSLTWAHETGRRGRREMEGGKGRVGEERRAGFISLERQGYKELVEINYNALQVSKGHKT